MGSRTCMPEGARLFPRQVRLAAGLLATTTLALLACGEGPPAEEQAVARPVKIVVFGEGAAGATREYPGRIEAAQTAELSFDVPGTIVYLPVQEGKQVKQGEVLARLDARDFVARADSEKAKMVQTGADLKRYEELYRENVIPRAQLDLKKSEYEVAEAAYREAAKGVEETSLIAPFDGVVARKLVDERENVQAKAPVLTIQGGGGYQIEVAVPEADVAASTKGLPLEERNALLDPHVTLSALNGRRFPARLTEFSTAADPVTRTFKATLSVDVSPDANVLPGMTAKVVVNRGPSDGAAAGNRLPVNAVLADDAGASFVWRVDPASMKVHRARVKAGEMSGSDIEILGGLKSGDLVAVSGVNNLREGMAVSRIDR